MCKKKTGLGQLGTHEVRVCSTYLNHFCVWHTRSWFMFGLAEQVFCSSSRWIEQICLSESPLGIKLIPVLITTLNSRLYWVSTGVLFLNIWNVFFFILNSNSRNDSIQYLWTKYLGATKQTYRNIWGFKKIPTFHNWLSSSKELLAFSLQMLKHHCIKPNHCPLQILLNLFKFYVSRKIKKN